MDRLLVCGRCANSAQQEPAGKDLWKDPAGWTELTLTGKPIRNMRLCPGCTKGVTRFIGVRNGPA